MPKYLTLFRFKGETLGRMMEEPSDREAALRDTVGSMGGSLEAYYVMFGQYDGCVIFEAPDSAAAGAGVVAVAASGAFAHMETHELFTAAQLNQVLDKAKSVVYKKPGEAGG